MKKTYPKLIFSLIPIIPLYIWGVFLVTSDPVHIFGFLSFFYFFFTLLVSPIAYILGKHKHLKRHVNTLISLRRPLGILTGIFAIMHMVKFYQHVGKIYEKFFASSQSLFEFIFISLSGSEGNVFGMNTIAFWLGALGILVMIFLLITSNNYSQKLIGSKNWKRLQTLAYPLFIIMIGHIYFIGGWKGAYLYPAIVLFFLRGYTWFDKNFQYTGRQRISHSRYRRFLCPPCGFIYDEELGDPDGGLAPGTKYEQIPDDWICPICGAAKKDFIPLDGHYNSTEVQDNKLTFVVHSKKLLTSDVIELQLYCEKELEIIPGQFCNLIFTLGQQEHMRSYSVSLYRDKILTFLIKLKDGGVAGEVLKAIKAGEEIQGIGPFGDFLIQKTSYKKIFIATGTGLSPIYNMMHASWDSDKILYFGVRTIQDIFYLEELREIPNLEIKIYLSKEETSSYNFGRIEYSKIKHNKDDEIYMCGSPGLIEDLQKKFEKQGKNNVFIEKFL